MTLPHVETNKERALRKRPARPVAVVEAARRPVTRGVKLPKFGPTGAKEKSPAADEKKKEGVVGKKSLRVGKYVCETSVAKIICGGGGGGS